MFLGGAAVQQFPGGEAEAQRQEETCPQTTWVHQRGGCGRWATTRRDNAEKMARMEDHSGDGERRSILEARSFGTRRCPDSVLCEGVGSLLTWTLGSEHCWSTGMVKCSRGHPSRQYGCLCAGQLPGTFCSCSRFVWRGQPCSAVGSPRTLLTDILCCWDIRDSERSCGRGRSALVILTPFHLEPRLQARVPLLSHAAPAGRREPRSQSCAGSGLPSWLGSWAPSVAVLSHTGAVCSCWPHTCTDRVELSCLQLAFVASAGPSVLVGCARAGLTRFATAQDSVGQPGLEGPLAGSALTHLCPLCPVDPRAQCTLLPLPGSPPSSARKETLVDWS